MITIIVLLILAGISISILTGENGIIYRAGEAKINTGVAQTIEEIKLSAIAALTDGSGTVKESTLKQELTNYTTYTASKNGTYTFTATDGTNEKETTIRVKTIETF